MITRKRAPLYRKKTAQVLSEAILEKVCVCTVLFLYAVKT